jgi:hypothetical protein
MLDQRDATVYANAHARLRELLREAGEISVFLTTMDRLMGPNPEKAFQDRDLTKFASDYSDPIPETAPPALEGVDLAPVSPSPDLPETAPVLVDRIGESEGEDQPGPQVLPNSSAPGKSGGEQSSPAPTRHRNKPTRTDRIRALHASNPGLTAREASVCLDIKLTHLRELSRHAGLSWTRAATGRPRRDAAQSPASVHPPAEAPERPPASIRPPVAASPSAGSAVVAKPMQRAPKGTRFYLRDDAGLFLHYGCENMTSDKSYAWIGTADQLLACRQKFAIARDLTERAVPRETAGALA